MTLYRLIAQSRESQPNLLHEIVSLMEMPAEEIRELSSLQVPVHSLGMRRGIPSIRALLALRRRLAASKCELIQGWMYHGNIAASVAAPSSAAVLWGIHHSLDDVSNEKPLTRALLYVGPRLSKSASRIVYCSTQSARQHELRGYQAAKSTVIPNGVDTEQFRPLPLAREASRAELGIPLKAIVIGHAARFHPMKNHAGLLAAFRTVLTRNADAFLVMAGMDVVPENRELTSQIAALGLDGRVRLAGQRTDMPRFMAALDLYVSPSSFGEAFPVILLEAMACGLPCVTTDVGDSRAIVGNTGLAVLAGNESALAEALHSLVAATPESRVARGAEARERVRSEFSLSTMASRYLDVYSRVLAEAMPA